MHCIKFLVFLTDSEKMSWFPFFLWACRIYLGRWLNCNEIQVLLDDLYNHGILWHKFFNNKTCVSVMSIFKQNLQTILLTYQILKDCMIKNVNEMNIICWKLKKYTCNFHNFSLSIKSFVRKNSPQKNFSVTTLNLD